MRYAKYVKDNPVVLLDLIKYAVAVLVLFGLPVPPGVDVAVAGVTLGVLTIITRSQVVPVGRHHQAVTDALMTPAPPVDAIGR
ncbi:hypothetical protein QTQ03_02135 [Micromonospora sp. WMMA1363]|uniref:hypothetical protein n=1 Tax=Micromonospora sp. WMMA1363 TaxID=3053985 RepID=UPI00259C7033|nr:hypothetical protein [Micromonospora sp. WMMA1363]MDM4718448.1 hypothetical protein [Micromonospora sp. WMMA1363]